METLIKKVDSKRKFMISLAKEKKEAKTVKQISGRSKGRPCSTLQLTPGKRSWEFIAHAFIESSAHSPLINVKIVLTKRRLQCR